MLAPRRKSGAPRKKKSSITQVATVAPSTSRAAAQAQITEFHTALKRRQHTDHASETRNTPPSADTSALDAYQKLSQLGQDKRRGGDSSKVLVPWLQQYRDKMAKFRLLEIGAVRHDNFAGQSSWISNTPIDIHSQHPDIKQQDFFDLALPETLEEQYDLVSCSLVLNFVGEPALRGQMLRKIHSQLAPKPTSMLFLVLPLPCVENSRYLTRANLVEMMADIGFELLNERWKATGKVGYWLWGWRRPRSIDPDKWSRKNIINEGRKRNNFAILLDDIIT